MHLHILDERLWFPEAEEALEEGLLAAGGDLSPERLLLAYSKGIFPWYDEEIPLWWCPDPRFVLFPNELKISKSMRQVMRNGKFTFSMDTAFEQVIAACATTQRKDEAGTWINEDVKAAYTQLHKMGYAHSAEACYDGKLVGGLYGVRMGKAFFGESMFSTMTNASKFAFIKLVQQLQEEGVQLIDCQVYTEHLESLGAEMISRKDFLGLLEELLPKDNKS